MKILMITQKIDLEDDILGIYHDWTRVISEKVEKLTVICLLKGKSNLPKEIKVLSLGKETGHSRLKHIKNFYKYIFQERTNYDLVFVHMNPIYILLGWWFWRLLGKKIFLWYAHPAFHWKVKLAYFLSDKVITSVPEAFKRKGEKVLTIGQGIDTDYFSRDQFVERKENAILSLGRLSRPKKIDVLIKSLALLKEKDIHPSLDIIGSVPEGEESYFQSLKDLVKEYDLSNQVTFYGAVPYSETKKQYNLHEVFINLSPTGYFDKTVLEAMSCKCLTLVSNEAYKHIFPSGILSLLFFRQNDIKDLAQKIEKVLILPQEKKRNIQRILRSIVIKKHSLFTFGERLVKVFL